MGITDFNRRISYLPETEPLYVRIKARVIDTSKIKDKNQRDYWQDLKDNYKIPQIYLSVKELDDNLIERTKKNGIKKIL